MNVKFLQHKLIKPVMNKFFREFLNVLKFLRH